MLLVARNIECKVQFKLVLLQKTCSLSRTVSLQLPLYLLQVSTDEIESLYKNHSVDQEQLHVFFLLRLALAPVIEAVILLDRLLYLHEQVSSELALT